MNKPVYLYQHDGCLQHDPGPGHPECPARLQAIMSALQNSKQHAQLKFVTAPSGTDEQILLAHTPQHLQEVRSHAPTQGRYSLDPDTLMSPGSLQAALYGVGAACAGVDALIGGATNHAFCLTRPPGHHACHDRAMGFCIFNHIAIAALHAMRAHGLERVAIVDFDVHHGNGTQDILQGRTGMHYLSTHQSPHYPGTGRKSENIPDNISNFPIFAGMDDAAYQDLFTREVLPLMKQGKPQLLLVSAGFDAHAADPLAGINLTEATYYWLGRQLAAFAREHCEGRMLSVLEGGYNLAVLGSSVEAYVSGTCY